MEFKDFKKATQRLNVLKRSDVAGSYHFGTATVSFESLGLSDIKKIAKFREVLAKRKKLSGAQYEALAKVMALAAHEYTHFIDSTSTVWGMKLLSNMNAAYSCSDEYQSDVTTFWQAKRFHDFLRSIALPRYYTTKSGAQNTRPWGAMITGGQIFDKEGRTTQRPVIFQRFLNAAGEDLVRSPISSLSILEASAMAQEVSMRAGLVASIEGDYGLVESKDFSRRLADYLYTPDLTEYSVCVHLVANRLGTTDIGIAFSVTAVLSRICLNITDGEFERLASDASLLERIRLPAGHLYSERVLHGLRVGDLGTAFYVLTTCLPRNPELTRAETGAVAAQAMTSLGIDAATIHSNAISFAEGIERELRGSPIEPIRWLSEAGLENLRRIDPLSDRLGFGELHLPKGLAGDSSELFILGDMDSPLLAKSVNDVYMPLMEGELWVERFAEGCL